MNEITKELLQALKTATEFMWHGPGAQGAMEYANEIIAKAESALSAPQEDGDGWKTWGGGDCPVSDSAYVEVRLRNGSELSGYGWSGLRAGAVMWWHSHGAFRKYDIVAYKVIKP